MLLRAHRPHNVVLFERLALDRQPGFNVLTGETGAGKSMILDAFALVLGGRASPDLVRAGEQEAEVEALFEIEPGSRIAAKPRRAGCRVTSKGEKGSWSCAGWSRRASGGRTPGAVRS